MMTPENWRVNDWTCSWHERWNCTWSFFFLYISRRMRPERAQNNPDGRQKIYTSEPRFGRKKKTKNQRLQPLSTDRGLWSYPHVFRLLSHPTSSSHELNLYPEDLFNDFKIPAKFPWWFQNNTWSSKKIASLAGAPQSPGKPDSQSKSWTVLVNMDG